MAASESLGSQTEFYDAEERLNSSSEETEVSDIISMLSYVLMAADVILNHLT